MPQFGCPQPFVLSVWPFTNLYLLPDKSLQIKWRLGQWLLFFKTRIRYSSCLIGRSMLFSATTSSSIATAASSTTAAFSTTNGRWWYYNFILRRTRTWIRTKPASYLKPLNIFVTSSFFWTDEFTALGKYCTNCENELWNVLSRGGRGSFASIPKISHVFLYMYRF